MNVLKFKQAEKDFLAEYPLGFQSPELVDTLKKHNISRLVAFAQQSFAPDALQDAEQTAENMIKLVSRSSIISLFEKPRFRDAVRSMSVLDREGLAAALFQLLHGDEVRGFYEMAGILSFYQLAKWTLLTVFRSYYYPDTDLIIKPSTVKNVVGFFELDGLAYSPKPSFAFYAGYRDAVNAMKALADPSLSPTLVHFCGFLMMATGLQAR